MTGTLHSPLVIIAATLMGIAAIAAVEAMERSGLMRGDAALGMVYPALFSVGVILVSMRFGSIHLDVDAVLMGELRLRHCGDSNSRAATSARGHWSSCPPFSSSICSLCWSFTRN